MDYAELDEKIEKGEKLRVTYKYPAWHADWGTEYRTRTDRLLAVEPSNGRVFVQFNDEFPVWIERDEVLAIEPAA